MEKTIITLEDNTEYVLLDETIIDGKKYYFAVLLDENSNLTKEYEVFLEEKENDDIYMTMLDNDEFKQIVLLNFTNEYIDNLSNIVTEMEESDK